MRKWIGGYPKSGTTWVKFIVCALEHKNVNPKFVERAVPNMPNPEKAKRDPWTYKTHTQFPPSLGKKIYIVRHPVDICVSGINHAALSSGKPQRDKYVEEFITKGGNTIGDFGSWGEHVSRWINSMPRHWFRYEALVDKTESIIREIAHFFTLPIENVPFAVEATSFLSMRKLEVNGVKASPKKNVPDVFYNPKHKGYKKGLYFINRGTYGYARDILTDTQIDRICDAFHDGMELIGYKGYESIS